MQDATTTQGPHHTPLSPAVQALLDDTADTPGVTSEASKDDIHYRGCLTLLITGNPRECLERLAVYNDPLEDYVSSGESSFDERVFELFISSCNELTGIDDAASLSASVRRAIGTVFDGKSYKSYLARLVKSDKPHDDVDQLRFLQKYFNSCITTATCLYDEVEKVSLLKVVEEQLVKVIDKYSSVENLSNKGSNTAPGDKVTKSELDPLAVQRLQELVSVYLFRLKVEARHCTKSEKLYWDLCDQSPHLQSILSSYLMDNAGSYQDRLLSLLHPEPQPKVVSTRTDLNDQPSKASSQLGNAPTEESQASIKRYKNSGTAGATDIYQLLQKRWSTVTKLLLRLPGILRRHPTLITLLTSIAVAVVTFTVRRYKLTRHREHYLTWVNKYEL